MPTRLDKFFNQTLPLAPQMPQIKLMQSMLLMLLGVSFLTSCADESLHPDGSTPALASQRVYQASFDEVGKAIKLAMVKYPQKIDNLDSGIFETDYLRGEQRFSPPQKTQGLDSGTKYKIVIRVVKGELKAKKATKVLVTKIVEQNKNFFAETKSLASDGLEEMVILYRIQRELELDRAVHRKSGS